MLRAVVALWVLALASSCTSSKIAEPVLVTTTFQTSGVPITETPGVAPTPDVASSDLVTLPLYPSGDPRLRETYSCPLFGITAVTDDGSTYGLGGCGTDPGVNAYYVVPLPVGQHVRIETTEPWAFTLSVQPTGPVTVNGPLLTAVRPGATLVSISHGPTCGPGTPRPPAVCPLMRLQVTG